MGLCQKIYLKMEFYLSSATKTFGVLKKVIVTWSNDILSKLVEFQSKLYRNLFVNKQVHMHFQIEMIQDF